jgi:sarcosine oxidase
MKESDPFIHDVIVMGLGAVGSAAAYQLAKRGARVIGIDRYSPPHSFGSSHGDTRITRLAIGEGAQYTPLVLRSHEIWREIEARTGEEILTVTGGLVISGPRRQATTHVPNFFENTLDAARRFGIAHEMLDAREIRKRFPQFNVRDNEVGYYEPGAGFLRPEHAIRAQLMLARRFGADIHCHERVLDYSSSADAVSVKTDHGEYRARQLIIAAGAWLPDFLAPDLARHFTVTRQVVFWFEVNAPAERFAPGALPVWIWELQERRNVIYGFPAIDGPAGGAKVATEQYESSTTPEASEREVLAEEKHLMYEKLVMPYLPELGPRCVKAISCLYTATPDFHFVIDRHPRHRNVIVASPCSGHGFKHSAAIGEALAGLALDGKSAIDLRRFTFERFQAARER